MNDFSVDPSDSPSPRRRELPLFIYSADVVVLTRKSERHAQQVLQHIRLLLGKERCQGVTVAEYADYMGTTVEEVLRCLGY